MFVDEFIQPVRHLGRGGQVIERQGIPKLVGETLRRRLARARAQSVDRPRHLAQNVQIHLHLPSLHRAKMRGHDGQTISQRARRRRRRFQTRAEPPRRRLPALGRDVRHLVHHDSFRLRRLHRVFPLDESIPLAFVPRRRRHPRVALLADAHREKRQPVPSRPAARVPVGRVRHPRRQRVVRSSVLGVTTRIAFPLDRSIPPDDA